MAVLQVFFRCNKRGDGVAAKSSQADKYDCLRLENQLCFPLYACAKEIVRQYKSQLAGLDLTYTQYIAMMVLWEHKSLTVSELGNKLYLDSGTLTPLLKKLEQKGYLVRAKAEDDRRKVTVTLTDAARGALERHAAFHEQLIDRVSRRLSAGQMEQLADTLSALHGFFTDIQ